MKLLGIGKTKSLNRPAFRVIGGEFATIVDAAEKELAKTAKFFQQGGAIVKVITNECGLTKLAAMNKLALNLEFNRQFTWEKYDKRSKKWFAVDAPQQYAAALFNAMTYEHLLPILSIANQPFFRDDNTLYSTSGYDHKSKIYGIFDESDYRLPEQPTNDEVNDALEISEHMEA